MVGIGDNFMPNCKESAQTATDAVNKEIGLQAQMMVLKNLTVIPYLGLGAMRNYAIGIACEGKADWLAILDGDVLIEDPLTFVKLIKHTKGFIVPWFDQSGLEGNHLIADPMYKADQGVQELKWTVPYCVLYHTSIFNRIGYRPHTETMIYDEDHYNCLYLSLMGIKLWQDTNTKVKLLRGPGLLADTFKFKVLKPFENP